MAKNLFGRLTESKIEAQELQSLLEKINIQANNINFDPEKSLENTVGNLKEINSLADQFYNYQKSIALGGQKNKSLTADQVKDLSKQVSLKKASLKAEQKAFNQNLKSLQAEISAKQKLGGLKKGEMRKLKQQEKTMLFLVSKQEEINKSLKKGVKETENLEKELRKAAKQATHFERANKALEKMNKLIEAIPFTSMLNPMTAFSTIISFIVKTFVEVDQSTAAAAKSLNRSYKEVENIRLGMREIAMASGNQLVNTRDMLEVFVAINEDLGTSLNFTKGMTQSQKEGVAFLGKMYKFAGLTLDEVKGLQKFSYFQARDVKKISGELMSQYKTSGLRYKVALNEKKVLKDIQTTSAFFKINIEGGAIGLADALAATQALAVSLDQVKNTAGGLLNFEQSIEKELSAELLLGKKINGEYMRTLAFNKDYKALAEEIRNTVGSSREEFERNAIQSQALADFLGMSVESMAQMVFDSEAAQEASKGTVDIEQQKVDLLGSQTAIAQEQLELQNQQVGLLDTFDAVLQKFIDTQLPGIFAGLNMMKDALSDAGGFMEKILSTFDLIKTAISVAAGLIAGKLIFQISNAIAKGLIQYKQNQTLEQSLNRQNLLLAEQSRLQAIIAGEKVEESLVTSATLQAERAKGNAISQNIVKQSTLTAGAVTEAGAKSTAAIAGSAGLLIPVILGGIAAVSAGMAIFSAMDDGVIGPGYGSRVLLTPQGGIAFNNKDTIIAGTNLTKGNDVVSSPEGSISLGGGSDSRLLEEVMKMNRNIENLANRPIDITTNIDGEPLINMKGSYPNEDALVSAKDSFKIS
jgi:hypothetical protein